MLLLVGWQGLAHLHASCCFGRDSLTEGCWYLEEKINVQPVLTCKERKREALVLTPFEPESLHRVYKAPSHGG
jgi:hypothetical protein